jgi:outer membrane protein assembly factor BamE (lipoprotein component of BamABCDE complex)
MTPLWQRAFLSISVALMLASCSPIVETRGQALDTQNVQQIVTGQTSAADVTALLGSPTSVSNFGDETWYYVTQKQSRVGVFAPEITEQHITAIRFDRDHIVRDRTEYTKAQGKPVQVVSKTTPTEGQNLTFLEQMLGNVGRFNAPGRGISDRNLGR